MAEPQLSSTDLLAKDGLAKLLATRNIKIIHSPSAGTASWFMETRCIVMPIFRDMGNSVYNLLIAHEVGHALFTPLGESNSGENQSFSKYGKILCAKLPKVSPGLVHGYINILEDSRIERLVLLEYPGLKSDFNKGYNWLLNRGHAFNGFNFNNLRSENFIDRINLAYKVGHLVDVPFTTEELPLLQRVAKLNTFQEVCDLVYDILVTYKVPDKFPLSIKRPMDKSEDEDPKVQDEEEAANGSYCPPSEESSTSASGNAEPENELKEFEEDPPASQASASYGPPEPKTVDIDSAIGDLIANGNGGKSKAISLTLANYELNHWITPFTKVLDDLTYKVPVFETEWYAEAQRDAVAMSARFHQMKQAREFQKIHISNSGKLNPKKLFNYHFSEDVFLKAIEVEKGKSHGIILIIDWSSSMMGQKFEANIVNLVRTAIFCRLNSIPIRVYAFSGYHNSNEAKKAQVDSLGPGDIYPDVNLIEFYTERMSQVQFRTMSEIMWCFAKNVSVGRDIGNSKYNLGGTPLSATMVLIPTLAKKMKKEWQSDILSVVLITDGGASDNAFNTYRELSGQSIRYQEKLKTRTLLIGSRNNDWGDSGCLVSDSSTQLVLNVDAANGTQSEYKWLITLAKVKCPGVKIINIYIADSKEGIAQRCGYIASQNGKSSKLLNDRALVDITRHRPTKIDAEEGIFDAEYLYCIESKFDALTSEEQKANFKAKSKKGISQLLYGLIDEVSR